MGRRKRALRRRISIYVAQRGKELTNSLQAVAGMESRRNRAHWMLLIDKRGTVAEQLFGSERGP